MMRGRALLVASLLFAIPAFAKDIYLSIGGSANGFFTDARILNPSFDKDITITARYLPTGNVDNSGAATKTITVGKRSMAIYDDVVHSLFGGGPALGAIRLTSDDDFVATQRIYADKRADHQHGTLGQFVPGLNSADAKRKGALIQLKNGDTTLASAPASFRTNWGAVNPNASAAHVTMKLYDKLNAVVATATLDMPPFAAIAPTRITDTFDAGSSDLTDSWISYDSDQPLFVWGSIVDNGAEDPTFVTASEDTGVASTNEPPKQTTVDVVARNWTYTVTPSQPLHAGDTVKFVLHSSEDIHGFMLVGPHDELLLQVDPLTATSVERVITLPSTGTYIYFCTHETCGEGHTTMSGSFDIQ
jgi:heme/copper-type cytochrome/quinol oxidase subunit 2